MQRSSFASYSLVIAASVSYAILTFVWFTLPAYLSIIIHDLGLTGTQAGVLTGAVPLMYVPLALFSGLAVDRIGPLPAVAIGTMIFGVAQLGRAVAGDFPTMLGLTLLVGVGATAITFGLPKLVSVLFPPSRSGLPSSLYLIGASSGTILAFSLGRPILGPSLGGWRPLFFWSGLFAVLYTGVLLGFAVLTHYPVSVGSSSRRFQFGDVWEDVKTILAHRQLRMVVVIGTMYLFVLHGLQGWLPTILEARGLAPQLAGLTTSLLIGANVVGVLVVPVFAFRVTRPPLAVTASGVLASLGTIGVLFGGRSLVAAVAIVVVGFGLGGLSPLIRAIPPTLEDIGPALTGVAVGLVFAVGELGGFLGPFVIGVFYDLTGSYAPGIGILALGSGVVIATGLIMEGKF